LGLEVVGHFDVVVVLVVLVRDHHPPAFPIQAPALAWCFSSPSSVFFSLLLGSCCWLAPGGRLASARGTTTTTTATAADLLLLFLLFLLFFRPITHVHVLFLFLFLFFVIVLHPIFTPSPPRAACSSASASCRSSSSTNSSSIPGARGHKHLLLLVGLPHRHVQAA